MTAGASDDLTPSARLANPAVASSGANQNGAMPIKIRELTSQTAGAWDRFVEASPHATFFHRSGWISVIQYSFGHRPHYCYVEEAGRIRGILPLFHIDSRLFGNRLTSVPFCVAGGPASDERQIDTLLDENAVRLMESSGARYIEYRDDDRQRHEWRADDSIYAGFSGPMEVAEEEQLSRIPRKQRAVLRKALSNTELSWTIDKDPGDLYRLYARNMRNHGTPVFPALYFRNLMQEFGEACEILTIRQGDRPVSSVMSFYFKDRVMPYYTGSVAEARSLGANDLMYWHVMRRGIQLGFKEFDFGRSKIGTGPYNFKKNWGFEPRPIVHQYYLRPGDTLPAVNPANPKYRLFVAMWRLLPLPVANMLGPRLVKGAG